MGSMEKLERRVGFGAKEWVHYVRFRLRNGLPVEEGFNLAMLEIEVPFIRLGFESFADFLKQIPDLASLLKNTDILNERSVVVRIESTETLKCGTRVVWFGADSTAYKGTIRWLGRVETILCAGVLCDKKVGHPFPLMWKENRLFYFPPGQGILLRVNEFILKSDYDQKSTSRITQALRRLMKKVNIRERPRYMDDSNSNVELADIRQYDVIYPYAVQSGPNELNVGDSVTWFNKNTSYTGTIKWLGHLNCTSGLIAGIDFAQYIQGNCSGIYAGNKLFDCDANLGRFIPIDRIQKIKPPCIGLKTFADLIYERPRSYESSNLNLKDTPSSSSKSISHISTYPNSNSTGSSSSAIDSLTDLSRQRGIEPHVTPERIKFLIGYKKGIQGRNQSCHLDSSLFALFSCTDAFDYTLLKSQESDSLPFKILKEILRTKIANKLRRNFYCSASNVQIVEQILGANNSGKGNSGDILQALFENAPKFLQFTNGTSTHVHKILASSFNLSQNVTTVQNLLTMDFKLQNLHLKCTPSAIILVFPEQNHELTPVSKFIIPNSTLEVTNLIHTKSSSQHSSPCVLCGENSEESISCPDCVNLDPSASADFCPTCYQAFHSHVDRRSHRRNNTWITMELQSIICTRQNHSVVYCKSSNEKNADWIAHDSMQSSSVPQVQSVSGIEACLEVLENDPNSIMKDWDSFIPEIKIILSFSHVCIYVPVTKRNPHEPTRDCIC